MNINFEKLFNEENIHKVNEEVDKYLPELFGQYESLEITISMEKLEEEIKRLNSSLIDKLFDEYQQLNYRENLQINWLAYTIGFYNGRAKKIKAGKEL